MRLRDKVFEDDWEQATRETQRSSLVILAHHFFGIAAIAIIILQSAISLNIYIFTIWLVLGLIILLLDISRGNKLNLGNELAFGFFFIFGTAFSLLLGNFNSMFFPDTLGRIDIILFQISAGVCVVIRLLLTLYYMEFRTHDGFFIIPTSNYSQDQLKQYQDNLTLTDFEQEKSEKEGFLKNWRLLFQQMLWPLVIIIILIIVAVAYSFMIYFIIPNDSIAELIIRPSLIVVAILYTLLLLRTHTILPQIKNEAELSPETEEDIEESDEIIDDIDKEIFEDV